MTPKHIGWGLFNQKEKITIGRWKIMIHEQEEMGLYEEYNINIPPLYELSSKDPNYQTKLKFSPVKRISLNKESRPCSNQNGYSRQRCLLECSWQKKLESIHHQKVANITCLPLGIVTSI